jgi:KaiC/GvpD/RAD55 family RecA-like ATPase
MADRETPPADGSGTGERKCDYCRLPIPDAPVVQQRAGTDYRFCSAPCRDTLLEEGRVFTEYHAARRFDPGVSALRAGLPQGVPRNSFVLVSGQPGTRSEALFGELVWRALQRDEPAVIVSFLDTPVSLVQEFVALGWNVLPYLTDGRLQIMDCFTYRLDDPESMARSMSDWNRHLHQVAERSTTRVRDPSNPTSVLNGIENCLDAVVDEDDEEGVVVIDSLTEFGSLVQPVRAYDFVKDLRASVPKARTVPVFAGGSRIGDGSGFPHDLGYVADGIIDLTLSDQLVEDALLKRIRVRKMSGVRSIRRWATYEFAPGRGLVAAKPDSNDGSGGQGGGNPPHDGAGQPTGDAVVANEARGNVGPQQPDARGDPEPGPQDRPR